MQVVSFSRGLAREETQECVRDGRAEAERIRAARRLPARREDNPQPDPEGSFRRRPASPVVESEGGMARV